MKPELARLGKFQKVSDRFTPGVPDVLGMCRGTGWAIELKEFKGVHTLKLHFRPGQLDWLKAWEASGGGSWIVSTKGTLIMAHTPVYGPRLETGCSLEEAVSWSSLHFNKQRGNTWQDLASLLVEKKN